MKAKKAEEIIKKVESDELMKINGVLASKQKDLEKICERANSSSYELAKKLDIIRA